MGERRLSGTALSDHDRAALVALSGLAGMSPRRLWTLLALGSPSHVWQSVLDGAVPPSGRPSDPAPAWREQAARIQLDGLLERHSLEGVRVLAIGDRDYPARLASDPDPPPVLFRRGDGRLDRVAVAVVGTRTCTRYGREIAVELGASLASHGVSVVSGLALGIDAAAHSGARRIDPGACVGVVGSGLDVVYPRSNRELWHAVGDDGVLVSEWPLGTPSLPWRFPARNRIIAALGVAVVVVESGERGGSLHTVDEAIRRDRPVFAVPGSIRSPGSVGTNRLIADGAAVLASIEDFVATVAPPPDGAAIPLPGLDSSAPSSLDPDGGVADAWLLDVLGWEPMSVDAMIESAGRSQGDVLLAIERLIAARVIARVGSMIERRR